MNIENIGSIEDGVVGISSSLIANETKAMVFELLSIELSRLRKMVVEDALTHLGEPSIKYIKPEHGMDTKGFDCSGFITTVLSKYGLSKKGIRHANEYFDNYGVLVQNPIPGDLIFWSRNGRYPTHIGIYIGEGEYIHAPGKDNTVIEVKRIKRAAIVGDCPDVLYTINPIGFKRITVTINEDKFGRWNKVV